MPARALDTHYNGYKFRSRLEARWAVFFDSAGVEYLYESEGFAVGDGVYYLPDFFLKRGVRLIGEEMPRQDVWVEIKPTLDLLEEDRQKIARFVRETGKSILLISGDPGPTAGIRFIRRVGVRKLDSECVRIIELADGRVGLIGDRGLVVLEREEDRVLIRQRMQTDLLVQAYGAARAARFDSSVQLKRCAGCGQQFRPKRDFYGLCYSCHNRKKRSKVAANRSFLISLPPKPKLIAALLLIPLVVVMLGWSTYQVVNLPNTLFRSDGDRAEPPTLAPSESLIRNSTEESIQSIQIRATDETTLIPTATIIWGDERDEPELTLRPTAIKTRHRYVERVSDDNWLLVEPAARPSPTATSIPAPTWTPTRRVVAPSGGSNSACSCGGNQYNCRDFSTQARAQACFNHCRPTAGDVHWLDEDNDGIACEWLP